MTKIKNCAALRHAINRGQHEFAILLAGGSIRSSKDIELDDRGNFDVLNFVDGSRQFLTGRQLYTHSNIGEAMRKGAFIAD